eukprot:740536-Rhodomonas_salina.5
MIRQNTVWSARIDEGAIGFEPHTHVAQRQNATRPAQGDHGQTHFDPRKAIRASDRCTLTSAPVAQFDRRGTGGVDQFDRRETGGVDQFDRRGTGHG